jgi:hypothetical protein
MEQQSHTVSLEIAQQENYSRGQLLLRSLFGFIYIAIPHLFVLMFMALAAGILRFIAWWAILFTGKHPKGFFDFQVGVLRWNARVNARLMNLADGYPPFGTDAADDHVKLNVQYPEKLNVGTHLLKTFFGFFYVLIPHAICLIFLGIAAYFVIFIAWWAVLITGKYPKGMHDFVVGILRWGLRVNAYMGYLTDEYPKFSGKP